MILTHFEYFCHMRSELLVKFWTTSLSDSLSTNWDISIFLMAFTSSEVNFSSSLLFLIIVHLLSWTNSSVMYMLTTSRAWSKGNWSSERIVWLSNSNKLGLRNIRSITEFELLLLFKYLMGIELVGCEKKSSKGLAMSISKPL